MEWYIIDKTALYDRKIDMYVFMYVHVLHMKPFFLPVDIQHNQCPRQFFDTINRDTIKNINWYNLCGQNLQP